MRIRRFRRCARAQSLNIIPSFAPSNRGSFTVSGVWKRNPQNLKALNAALRHDAQPTDLGRRRRPLSQAA